MWRRPYGVSSLSASTFQNEATAARLKPERLMARFMQFWSNGLVTRIGVCYRAATPRTARRSAAGPQATLRFINLLGRPPSRLIGQSEHRIRQPPPERLVVHELFEQLGVVLEHRRHDARERLIVLDAGVLLVGVLLGILVGGVGRYAAGDVLRDQLVHAV